MLQKSVSANRNAFSAYARKLPKKIFDEILRELIFLLFFQAETLYYFYTKAP